MKRTGKVPMLLLCLGVLFLVVGCGDEGDEGDGMSLSGVVTYEDGSVAANISFDLVPSQYAYEQGARTQAVQTDSAGRYEVKGIQPGEYMALWNDDSVPGVLVSVQTDPEANAEVDLVCRSSQ